jgi:alpha-glucoside transport system permease protein
MNNPSPRPVAAKPSAAASIGEAAAAVRRAMTSRAASVAALCIAIIWTLPTFGLFITSLRPSADIQTSGWWNFFGAPSITLDNYAQVLGAQASGRSLPEAFVNSLAIAVPSVLVPAMMALLAAYAFAWTRFRGRDFLFVLIVGLQIVPIQVTLTPLLQLFVSAKLAGSFWPIWISHAVYSLPLAVFLLHNFMRELPRDLIEAARIDGASHVDVFLRVIAPLMTPAVAAFAVFQFLWVWNDLLVALTFANTPSTIPMTVALANLSGSQGGSWFLLSAAAFVAMFVPVIVFLSLQRYFVRGLLAGSVKG